MTAVANDERTEAKRSDEEPPTPAAGGGFAMLRAEIALCLVTVALGVSFARLFRSGHFIPKLVLVVIVAHALSAIARRRRIPFVISIPLLAIAAVLLLSWLYLPHTLSHGVPSGATWSAARTALHGAFSPFRRLVPPVPITLGFELTMGIGLWVLAAFADAASFSADAPVQALIPHAAAFLGSSIFARGRDDVIAAAAMAAAALVFFAAHRAYEAGRRQWVQLEGRRGATALFGTGTGIALVAVVIAAVVTPFLPGSGSKPVVDLRTIGKGPGPIQVGNPLVGVGNMLAAQSNQLFFTVRSPAEHYWRLTSLEEFDSSDQQWKTRRSYSDVDSGEPLPGADLRNTASTETDQVTLTALPGIWLPSPYQPKEIDAKVGLRYDSGSSSVIAAGRSSLPDTSYTVTAAIPSDKVSPDARPDRNVDPIYLEQPKVGAEVRQVVDQVTADQSTTVGKLLALETYFRTRFLYSTSVDYAHAADPTVAFLNAKTGFCQQFASTFAVMARMLGIPSRVAVGFTYGTATGKPDSQGRTEYQIRGKQAHAWPEVHLTGVGWVAFEPTPGRGNPDSQQLTPNIRPQQDDSTPAQTATTTTTAPANGSPATTVPSTGRIHLDEPNSSKKHGAASSTSSSTGGVVLIVAIVLAALVALAVAARAGWVTLRRRRHRGRGDTAALRVRAAWIDSCEWLELVALTPRRAETAAEFGRRASATVPVEELAILARLETERLFGDEALEDGDADAAESVARQVRAAVVERTDRRQRLAHLMGWERRN